MRRFHSYGPVDCRHHFCVERKELTDHCFKQLIGISDEGGHYFTIWSPRQCGKTWLMRQVRTEIETRHPDRFIVGTMSVQGVVIKKDEPPEAFLSRIPLLFSRFFKVDVSEPESWEHLGALFSTGFNLFKKPMILFIDEFDKLPPPVIDRLVGMFRDMYLDRSNFCLHGLALIGVRAVLGVESGSGSPFNVQRSLHVPNLTREEVRDLCRQYQTESGQRIDPEVVERVYDSTRGQPGLVSWFGELLTEKYNQGLDKPIDVVLWKQVYARGCYSEWNNTVLNIVKKVRTGGYQTHIIRLFSRSDIRFSIDAEWCSYLYLNGVIDKEDTINDKEELVEICRFSNPFIQLRLYNALTTDLIGDRLPILALEPLDDLSDVFDDSADSAGSSTGSAELNVPALLERYKAYLKRLKAKGINPWKDQPRRSDMHYTEYVGHFHLYFWLRQAIEDLCAVSPEFPTGNGRVDIHLKCGGKKGVIEVKSFKNLSTLKKTKTQAADYAKKLNLKAVTIAVFAPIEDDHILNQLSGESVIDGVQVNVAAIGWT